MIRKNYVENLTWHAWLLFGDDDLCHEATDLAHDSEDVYELAEGLKELIMDACELEKLNPIQLELLYTALNLVDWQQVANDFLDYAC